jgi:hypothetical protein
MQNQAQLLDHDIEKLRPEIDKQRAELARLTQLVPKLQL